MCYPSVDQLQRTLADSVFHYASDKKKAAGRALGTIVEIITFYALKSWGFEKSVAIERPLPEYANSDITHNVEYSLHPSQVLSSIRFEIGDLPLTTRKIVRYLQSSGEELLDSPIKSNTLLSRQGILRNSYNIYDSQDGFLNAYLDKKTADFIECSVALLQTKPFAMFECKRVGVEEGTRKGPQTIEKAKQGAYVARNVSALQKIRLKDGRVGGLIQNADEIRIEEYYTLLAEILASNDPGILADFILTVGGVSNHGNWFTSDNPNKELRVLAQSYDWLLFLTDNGIAQFIVNLLLTPTNEYYAVRDAFQSSYTGERGNNQFTKVQIAIAAHNALNQYFAYNRAAIMDWFNVIAPKGKDLSVLIDELSILRSKNWWEIHQ